jgi:hypothetical protein
MSTKITRSGRLVKKPDRYVPIEKVEDDYATDEHDTDTDDESDSEEEEEELDSDSEGSLVDFVVPDSDSEDDESETE